MQHPDFLGEMKTSRTAYPKRDDHIFLLPLRAINTA